MQLRSWWMSGILQNTLPTRAEQSRSSRTEIAQRIAVFVPCALGDTLSTPCTSHWLTLNCRVSVLELATLFCVRQQRVMAILALREIEEEERAAGEDMLDELQDVMEGSLIDGSEDSVWGCNEVRGTGERHVRLLKRYPAYEVHPHRPHDPS